MKRFRIIHRTRYDFTGTAQLGEHQLRLRPREGHELRIESSSLLVTPPATIRWRRDMEDNSIAIATFSGTANYLLIESEVIIQQYNEEPQNFLVVDYAIDYPFVYVPEERVVLAPYMNEADPMPGPMLSTWLTGIYQSGEAIQTYALLQRLCLSIHESLNYQLREEPGVNSAEQTLSSGTGSCRDFANLFILAARQLGFAARFVSGYLHVDSPTVIAGSTHAWAEVYLPGAGWKGFDPTIGEIAGSNHIAVAVSRLPSAVPPVAGSYIGAPGTNLHVEVWVLGLD